MYTLAKPLSLTATQKFQRALGSKVEAGENTKANKAREIRL